MLGRPSSHACARSLSFARVISEAESSLPCLRHGSATSCRLPAPGVTDCLVACGACQPYSTLRDHSQLDPREHADHKVLFSDHGSVLALARKQLPASFVSEQVLGFRLPYSRAETVSPLDEFLVAITAIVNERGERHFTGIEVVVLDAKVFSPQNRNRLGVRSRGNRSR